jgi:hypothetical protein
MDQNKERKMKKVKQFGETKEKTHYCPGEICDVKTKQEIQKTSLLQIGVVIVSFTFVVAAAILFKNSFSAKPTDLWNIVKSVLSL